MGMDLTDEQIKRIQNMMNPETLKMKKNVDRLHLIWEVCLLCRKECLKRWAQCPKCLQTSLIWLITPKYKI